MIDSFTHSPVFPVVPCYNDNSWVDYKACMDYIKYLKDNGASILMTTAGTSQFNLLSNKQIRGLNQALTDCADENTTIIIGLKPQSTDLTIIELAHYEYVEDTRAFFLLKYPERFYDRETIVNYFHQIADEAHLPCLVHCAPIVSGLTGQMVDYNAEVINRICEHDNIVGIKEEINDGVTSNEAVQRLSDKIGIIYAGESQSRYRRLHVPPRKHDTFLAGVGSLFPQLDISMNEKAENMCFKVFFKHRWHPALRYALQYLKLIPEHNVKPWPELPESGKTEIKNVVDEIKEMV